MLLLTFQNGVLRGQSNLRPSTTQVRTPRLPGSKSQRSTGVSRQQTSSPRKIEAVSGFQAEQLKRVGELESRMSRLIAAVEQRLATAA